MTDPPWAAPDPPSAPASSSPARPGRAGRRESPAWSVGIPALLGAALGTLIGLVWRALVEPGRPAEDSLGLLYLAAVVGLPVLVAVSWGALALTGPAWAAPAVTVAGLASGTYAVGLYRMLADTPTAPPVAVCTVAWAASYVAVALACRPGAPRPLRAVVVALLVAPAVLFLVF